jgi:hydrogenase maturation protease
MNWGYSGLFDMTVKTGKNLAVGERILVLGLGNILLKDEGIGVHVIRELQGLALPENVEVIDGGTAGLDMLLSQEGSYKLVVVDAAKAGEKPGTIYKAKVKGGEMDKLARTLGGDKELKISSHQFGLIESLTAAQSCGCAPREIVIIGVEPKEINYGLEPTEQVSRRIPEIIKMVLEEF